MSAKQQVGRLARLQSCKTKYKSTKDKRKADKYKLWNSNSAFAYATHMTEKELWEMFAKTGDVEWYSMYRSLKEQKERKNATNR